MKHDESASGLSVAGLEASYDALAQAIDDAGAGKTELLLVKLALLCAQALGDESRFLDLLARAGRDL